MKIVFMIMFLFFIIAPFIYILYTIRMLPKKYKTLLWIGFLYTFFIMIIKIIFNPYNSLFIILTLIAQFYIICLIIISICYLIYQLFTHFFHKDIKKIGLIISLFAISITTIGFYTHFQKITQKYDVIVEKESSLKDLDIVMISDVHLGTGTYLEDIERLVTQINQNEHDILFFCGDIFDEETPQIMIEKSLQLFSQIKTKFGMYAVGGNHENYIPSIDVSFYEKNNIHYLSEKYVCVDGLFNIVGREDVSSHNNISMSEICLNMDTTLPTIVLDHNPKRYEESMEYADIQFSGHTHGGQFFPGNTITSAMYDNAYGLLHKKGFTLLVSCGFGSWGFPFRFLSNCEIVHTSVTFLKN